MHSQQLLESLRVGDECWDAILVMFVGKEMKIVAVDLVVVNLADFEAKILT